LTLQITLLVVSVLTSCDIITNSTKVQIVNLAEFKIIAILYLNSTRFYNFLKSRMNEGQIVVRYYKLEQNVGKGSFGEIWKVINLKAKN